MAAATADQLAALIREAASKVETARAKINLALHVLGRRTDGYHSLDSLVVFADTGDTLEALPREESLVKVTIDGPFADDLRSVAAPEDNLIARAATQLADAFPKKRPGGVRVHLTKRLPVAAGLGGGSADAAAALRLLNRVWSLGAAPEKLATIGLRLGADVPICLVSRPLRAEGVGERVKLVGGIPALPMLLVHPGVAVPTASVFRRLPTQQRTPMWPVPRSFLTLIEFAQWLRLSRNDLTDAAVAEAPVIGRVLKRVSADPECLVARMSGSGATVFGIFNSLAAAERAAARMHATKPTWWVAVTRTEGS